MLVEARCCRPSRTRAGVSRASSARSLAAGGATGAANGARRWGAEALLTWRGTDSTTQQSPRCWRSVRAARELQHLGDRSEEHTSELQSPCNLVCRLLLEKKKKKHITNPTAKYVLRDSAQYVLP